MDHVSRAASGARYTTHVTAVSNSYTRVLPNAKPRRREKAAV